VASACPVLRFAIADPKQFREREIGEGRIAREFDEARKTGILRKLLRLFFGALIAPDDGGSNDVAVAIEQNRAMHLTGETDAGDVFSGSACVMKGFFDSRCACTPPIDGILFGPTALRRGKGLMVMSAGGGDAALSVHQQGARPASAHVNAEKVFDCRLRM